MKRKIKFRGKKIDTGEWVFGSLLSLHPDICEVFFVESVDKYNGVKTVVAKVNPDTVGQFTGLLDKNGKEIYEGDILLIDEVWDGEDGNVKIHNEVGIKDGCFGYIGENTEELLPFCESKITEEIVGNIHDNPELLKGGA